MGAGVTIGIAAAGALLGVLFGWLGARPPNPLKGPRLAPYRLMMLLCAVGVLMMLAHLVNLMGLHTGR